VTFYHDTKDLPDFEDYSMKGRTYRYLESEPLYPFGYGLTYGDARITNVVCNGQKAETGSVVKADGEALTVEATVANKSQIPVQEVVQVYIHAKNSENATPHAKLCGFARVSLKAGESASVQVPIDQYAYTVVNEDGKRIIDSSAFEVSVGFNQPDARSKELTGKECVVFTVEK
jgi:beta-glucosidase